MGGALGWFALGAAFVLIFGLFVLVSALFGVQLFTSDSGSATLGFLTDKNFMIVSGICVALPALLFVVGLLAGKSGARR
jgi:hypothetical protein